MIFLFLQNVSSCLAEHPSCKGPSVNLFRLWVLRETKLEKRLNICPDVDSKDLENSVSNTGKIARNGNCFALVVIIVKPFFPAGPTREIPSRQDRPILPAKEVNQKTGFASSCPLVEAAIP